MDRAAWYGLLALDNIEAVAQRMSTLLTDRWYTVVVANEGLWNYRPEVRPSQRLSHGCEPQAWTKTLDNGSPLGGIHWADAGYSFGIYTTAATQQEARAQPDRDRVHITFGQDRWGGRVVIEHYAPAGFRLYWTFAVEAHS
jgi:hypothetical protein